MPYWRTCVFQGIGTKKQVYLDLLSGEMARKGFQRDEKNKFSTLGAAPFLEESNPMLKTPDGKFSVAIKAIPCNGDLKAGFMIFARAKQNILFFVSFTLGLLVSIASVYIIRYAVPSLDGFPLAMLWLIIWFSIGLGLPLFSGLSVITWNRQLMQILVKKAESMDSKQITPFKRTWPTKM